MTDENEARDLSTSEAPRILVVRAALRSNAGISLVPASPYRSLSVGSFKVPYTVALSTYRRVFLRGAPRPWKRPLIKGVEWPMSEFSLVYERLAAMDVHKESVTVTIRVPGPSGRHVETRRFGTMTVEILTLRDWLESYGIKHVAMESTGVYWKPIYHLLEDHMEIVLVNAAKVKNVPGRKTDVKDSEWLAQLMEAGLLTGSFVPPRPFRDLRDLTRFRKQLMNDRTREVNRLHKLLQDAGIKLSSVATDIMGKSGRAMIEALIGGTNDPEALAELAKGRLRSKIPMLQKALVGKFRSHHAFMAAQIFTLIDGIEASLDDVSSQIDEMMRPFGPAVTLLMTHPGLDKKLIEDIVAEITTNMEYWPTSRHIASWSAICPGNNESAGRRKSGKTRHGNKWLCTALVQAARSAIRVKDSYYAAQYRRIVVRRGDKKAIIAVAHSILVTIYHMLRDGTLYQDLGGDYFHRRDEEASRRRAIASLEKLGFKVTLEPVETPVAASAAN